MEAKINKKLEKAGLVLEDFTTAELQELRKEIAIEEKGEFVLDGVLHHVSTRKFKEEYRRQMQAILDGKK
ncbi:MAG: hypothetical protein IJZ49_06035 [Alistipes sp.]|nr:hypothetical protein [Alistipes sp.]